MNPNTKVSHDNERMQAKKVVLDFHDAIEKSRPEDIGGILDKCTIGKEYLLRSVYPFREVKGASSACKTFWKPFKKSFKCLQRRPDIFIAGRNSIGPGVWVLSMGHFLGLFDSDWIGIRATRQIAMLRYAEFTHVCMDTLKVVQTGLFLDIVGLMQSVGMNPLPPSTGSHFCYPGPRTHDGLLMDHDPPPNEGIETQALVDRMVADLSSVNHLMTCSPDVLRKTWHEDMLWYGPGGIGATYTIPRYQEQHQLPFRAQLGDKKFHGHQVRIAEGNYAAFFGWPMNLTNTPLGGFLGLPGGTKDSPMQVVDVYRRQGEKLAENWVLIDIPWYLKHQGLDILQRTTGILNPVFSQVSESSKRSAEVVTSDSEPDEPPTKKVATEDAESLADDTISEEVK